MIQIYVGLRNLIVMVKVGSGWSNPHGKWKKWPAVQKRTAAYSVSWVRDFQTVEYKYVGLFMLRSISFWSNFDFFFCLKIWLKGINLVNWLLNAWQKITGNYQWKTVYILSRAEYLIGNAVCVVQKTLTGIEGLFNFHVQEAEKLWCKSSDIYNLLITLKRINFEC